MRWHPSTLVTRLIGGSAMLRRRVQSLQFPLPVGEARTLQPDLGLGAMLGTMDWDNVRGEVDRENQSRITLIGAAGVGKRALLHRLMGSGIDALHDEDEATMNLGLFSIVDVPTESQAHDSALPDPLAALADADVVVWLLDATTGLRAFEHEWICRVRSSGRPLILALNKIDVAPSNTAADACSAVLAAPVIPISAGTGEGVLAALLPRIADTSPQLNTALGREVPAWRPYATQRVTERAALLSGLVGVEPLPLLDLPFQVMLQLRLVMRIAAIHGEPQSDRYSRELIATMVGGAALRYAGQQVAKAVPLLGWAASGALAAGGTWAIGKAAEAYFANGKRLPTLPTLPHLPPLPSLRHKENPK
jgi:uncharacterized protein (DUF697 family)